MSKKVSFGTKPSAQTDSQESADRWVEDRTTEPTKRLTIDVPASLHARIKATCALRGEKMAEAIREILEEQFPEQPKI
jgi:hypothetical protein